MVLDLGSQNEGKDPNCNHVSDCVGNSENREGASEEWSSILSGVLGLPELNDWGVSDGAGLVKSGYEVASSSSCFHGFIGRALVVCDEETIHFYVRDVVADVGVLDTDSSGLHLVVEHA